MMTRETRGDDFNIFVMNIQTIPHPSLSTPSLLHHDERSGKNREGIAKPPYCKQFVYMIPEPLKDLLLITLLAGKQRCSVVIYVRTNFASDSLAEKLNRVGIITESVHGNKSQRTTASALRNFRDKVTDVIVATESAVSVFDMKVATVINYDLPLSAETYSKRMSRHSAARTLKTVISFCDLSEQAHLSNINSAFPDEIEMLAHNLA